MGVHHFAFLRSWFQGVDLRQAWDRYMAFAEPGGTDLRHLQHRRTELLGAVLRAGHQLDLGLPTDQKITPLLALLAREPFSPGTVPLPSLDDFVQAQSLDVEMYSQAELLGLYREHYGLDDTPDTRRPEAALHEQIRALNHVGALLARAPSSSDRLDVWLAPPLAARLKAVGIIDLRSLVAYLNVHGHRWYRRVAGVGQVRATALAQWLLSLGPGLDEPLRDSVLTPPQRQAVLQDQAARDVAPSPRFGLVPLAQLLVPSPLLGQQGIFRTGMPNTLGAHDDLQALRHWLSRYEERPHTRRSYTREVERFYLWCLHERRKPLSSIDAIDCQAYRQFLADIPLSWTRSQPTGRHLNDWRPFKGPLAPASQKQALVIVQTMFEGLQKAGYLVANPMAAVMKGFNLPASSINIERSFTEAEWQFVMRRVAGEPEGPARRRLHMLLELLGSTGLRLEELAQATMGDLRRVRVDGEDDPAWILTVTGKRQKRREVPVPDEVVDLIQRHQADCPALPHATADAPLVRALGPGVPRWRGEGATAVIEPPRPQAGLGRSGIYQVLKRFFRRASLQAGREGLDGERLLAASTHWLRHTFARQAAVAQVPLEVVQQALGHASLHTTSVYLSTERSRMIRELRKLR